MRYFNNKLNRLYLILLLIWAGWIIHFLPGFLSISNKAKESLAVSVIKQMNQRQKEHYRKKGYFLQSFITSEILNTEQLVKSNKFNYYVKSHSQSVYHYAIPIKDYEFGKFLIFPWNRYIPLKRYIGAVFVIDAKSKKTVEIICAVYPQEAPLKEPILKNGVPVCQRYTDIN